MSSEKVNGKYIWGDITESEIVRQYDRKGREVACVQVDDMFRTLHNVQVGQVPDLRATLKLLKDMPMRTDDIFICAYVKAGTHWMWEIVNMLLRGSAEYDKTVKEENMIDFHFPKEFENLESPRVFNSHFTWRHLPTEIRDKKCKIIFLQRNPKDTAVSYFHHMKNLKIYGIEDDCGDFIDLFMKGRGPGYKSWFDYTLEWQEFIEDTSHRVPILSLMYEDLKQNPVAQVQKVAEFLKIQSDTQLVRSIAEKCDFKNMRKAVLNKNEAHPSVSDYQLLYRKGQIGDWKNWFTVAQSEEFDELVRQKMGTCTSKFVYE
ncbi:sulfotransferase 1A1-like [Mizuhopecten yessoensis]|uniref:Sulfotransferase 1A1 n=1 Tax=Mizuhopecten yessoensis TaxID=6573 RepID=A0A210R1L3_MIZYE|nr:sulfotransferase 1A1-like [Mizuhopecten yessoensis]OWF54960.1 Sulfotransferase 1A1 [Mizuhopecten yessoensis]